MKRLGLDTRDGYKKCYNYGGREALRKDFGLGRDELKKIFEKMYEEA